MKQALRVMFMIFVATQRRAAATARYPNSQLQQTTILRGTIITPDQVIADGLVTISGSRIVAVTSFAAAKNGLKFVDTDSYILPGLVDVHNHIEWNFLPRWRPKVKFVSRAVWQDPDSSDYQKLLKDPHAATVAEGLRCDADLYGEVKAIVGGATSTIGSGKGTCIEGLARNLDVAAGTGLKGPPGAAMAIPKVVYNTFPFDSQNGGINPEVAARELDSGAKYLIHVAEGTDSASAYEFKQMWTYGLLRQGVSVIHGVAFGKLAFGLMAGHGVGLIWSPRSDFELYGATADVQAAKLAGVKIALAPDWSPTGSDGLVEELNYAATWDKRGVFRDSEFVRMVTATPAELAGLGNRIGSVAPGYEADLLLIRRSPTARASADVAYHAVVHASPASIRLVMIAGAPIYGDFELMNQLRPHQPFEAIVICGRQKALNLATSSFGSSHSFHDVSSTLEGALKPFGEQLAPLTSYVESRRE